MGKKQPRKDYSLPEVGPIYQSVVQDIAFFKRQQWIATNYVVLVYVVMAWLADRPEFRDLRLLLFLLALGAGIVGWYVLLKTHQSMGKGRKRLHELNNLLPEEVGDILTRTQDVPNDKKGNPITFVFMAVHFVGLILLLMTLFPLYVPTSSTSEHGAISGTVLDSIGLTFSIFGAVLLTFVKPERLAVPGVLASGGSWEMQKEAQSIVQLNSRIWWAGLALLIIGFVMQLVGHWWTS